MAEVRLTKVELIAMLGAKIRRRASWKFRGDNATVGSLGMVSFDDDVVAKVAVDVHNDIVADFSYDEKIVKATRAVKKFNQAYVRRVIKDGIKNGSVQMEALAATKIENSMVKTEGLPAWLKKKKT